MRYKNRITALFVCVLLICSLNVVSFAHDVPKENTKGKITIEMKYGKDSVVGGVLTAYRVGQIEQSNGNYYFVKTDEMKDFDGSYDDITSPELADNIFAFVKENDITEYAKAQNKNGKAEFSNVDLGLYLVVQTKVSEGYEPLKPFLVSVPMNVNGRYIYEVNAEGKFAIGQTQNPIDPSNQDTPSDPSETTNPDNPNSSTDTNTTTNPSGEKLPLTGQLNWPIPILTAGGLLLFALGWFLTFGRKRANNAK